MARNFLTGLRLVNLTADPATGSEGEMYYNTVSDRIRLYSNGQWADVVAASGGSLFNTDIISYPDYIAFDTTPENTSATVGTISWDDGESLLKTQISTNTAVELGQTAVALSYNAELTTLNKGEVVYLYGAQGQRPAVKRAYNTSDDTSATTFGIVAESIAAGQTGFIITKGIIQNIDTNSYNEGDILWLDSTPGQATNTKVYAPYNSVFVGVVLKKNSSAGRIFVNIQNGYEMEELHNVYAQNPSNNDILVYTSASTMWVAKNLATAITAVDGSGSNIDADLLDGQHGLYYAPINSPTFTGTSTFPTLALTTADTSTAASHYIVETASDGIIRPKTLANVRTEVVTTAAVNSASATVLGSVTTGTWSATNITLDRGGTNASLTAVNGGIVYSTASAMAITAAGTAGQVLTSNGSSAPTWQSAAGSNTLEPFFLSGM